MPSLNSPSTLAANPDDLSQAATHQKPKTNALGTYRFFATTIKGEGKKRKEIQLSKLTATTNSMFVPIARRSRGEPLPESREGQRHTRSSVRTKNPIFFPAVRTNTGFWWRRSCLLVSLCCDCMFVCFVQLQREQRQRLPFCHCQKTFQRAHCIADANQRIKGMLQSRQRGFDANLQTSNNHYW